MISPQKGVRKIFLKASIVRKSSFNIKNLKWKLKNYINRNILAPPKKKKNFRTPFWR